MKAIIFDVDHTLLNFDEDENEAFRLTCLAQGFEPTAEQIHSFWELSYESWTRQDLHLIHTEEIQTSFHDRYRKHVKWLFANYHGTKLKEGSEDVFMDLFSKQSHLIGDSLALLERLSARYDLYLATNGLSFTQRGRTKPFLPFVKKVFISEEVGIIKPNVKFFKTMLDEIALPPSELLMVGDSYPSDMIGAMAVGMKTCFIRRHGEEMPNLPDYVISRVDELEKVL